MTLYLGGDLDDVPARLGEVLDDVGNGPATVGKAIAQHRGKWARDVGRERVAHLHRQLQFLGPNAGNGILTAASRDERQALRNIGPAALKRADSAALLSCASDERILSQGGRGQSAIDCTDH